MRVPTGQARPSANVRDMLARLIAFETVSSRSNLDCIDFILDTLARHGIASSLVPSPDGKKANLYATIGPNRPGGIVFSGHTDVVPVEDQSWTSDPWRLTERDGALFGRGTCDMKGFLAIVLAAVPMMASTDLVRPVHLAFSYDEEVGCRGAPAMVVEMEARLPAPAAVIVGEPTRLEVVSGHKASLSFHTEVTGHTVHSSRIDLGVSAVTTAARLVTWLDDVMEENRADADPASPFAPPYTTLHCGMIQGGTAANIVSARCSFVTDIRVLPAEDPWSYRERYDRYIREVVEPRMKRVAPAAGIAIHPRSFVPGLRVVAESSAERITRRILGSDALAVVSYGTEAGLFQEAGWPTVVCGPGSIEEAHKADEFITLDQIAVGERFVQALVQSLVA